MRHFSLVYVADGVTSLCPLSAISDIGALGPGALQSRSRPMLHW